MIPPRRRRTRWRVDSYGTNQYSDPSSIVMVAHSSALASTDLLDVVVRQGAAILKLLASEDETLLVWGNALLVLDLALHIVDGVGGLDLEGDGLARQGLNEAVAIYALVAIPSFAHVCWCRGRSVRFAGAVFGSRFRGREYVHLHCEFVSISFSRSRLSGS
jgi:hypothetical protein